MRRERPVARPTEDENTKSARTRQRVLDAAAQVMSNRGYTETRLADIAALADLRAPTLYYYFPSREVVVTEVLRLGFAAVDDSVRDALSRLPGSADAVRRLTAAADGYVDALCGSSPHAAYSRAQHRNLAHVPESVRDACAEQLSNYLALWHGLVADVHAAGRMRPELNLNMASMYTLGLVGQIPQWWHTGRDDPRSARQHARWLIINGIVREEARV